MSGSKYFWPSVNHGYNNNNIEPDKPSGTRYHVTESRKRHLPEKPKPSSPQYAYAEQDEFENNLSRLRSTLRTAKTFTHDKVYLEEDKSKLYTHQRDSDRHEKNNRDRRKHLDHHSNTLTNNHIGLTSDYARNESYIRGTSASPFPVSSTYKSEKQKIKTDGASTHSGQIKYTVDSAERFNEKYGYQTSIADTPKEGTLSSKSQIRGGSAKHYKENSFDCAGKLEGNTQFTYDNHRYLEKQTRNSPDSDRSTNHNQEHGIETNSSLYKVQDGITFKNQSQLLHNGRVIYDSKHIENEDRDVRLSTLSKTYYCREKNPQQITGFGTDDRQREIMENSPPDYRYNDVGSSTPVYRDTKFREKGQQKETMVGGPLNNSDKEREMEKLTRMYARLKLKTQETERGSKTKQITVEQKSHQSATDYEVNAKLRDEKEKQSLVSPKTYSSSDKHPKHVTDYRIHDSLFETTANNSSTDRFRNDEYTLDYREKSREKQQPKKTSVDHSVIDKYDCDKEKDKEIDNLKKRNERLSLKLEELETKRREELRDYMQQNKTVVDRPVTSTYTIDKEKDREIKKLKKMNERLMLDKRKIEERSDELTKQLSKQMKFSNHFENCNDDFSSSRVAEKFRNLYDRKWVTLCRWISKNFRMIPEINVIQYLSYLMKSCYKECLYLEENQIRHFLILGVKDVIPKHEEHQGLFEMRKQYAQSDVIRKQVIKTVKDKLQIEESMSIYNLEMISCKGVLEKLDTFLEEFADTCWIMTVSEPAIALEFDVVGKMYSDCVDHFSTYSLKRPVDDPTKTKETVYEVVWPCVQLKSTSEVYKKGDVILITKNTKDICTQT